MRRIFAIISLLFSAALAGRAQDLERQFAQSFPSAHETVAVRAPRGVIEVVSVPAGREFKCLVDLRVQNSNAAEKRSLVERLTPDLLAPLKRDIDAAFAGLAPRFKDQPKRLEITVRDSRPVVFDSDLSLQMIITIKLEVPAGTNLEVRTVNAGVVVDDFSGSLDLRGEGGSYFVKSVTGDFSATTTSGSITVGDVGGRSKLRTASGNILTGKLRGAATLFSSNGDVEVQQALDTLKIGGDDAAIIVGVSQPLPKSMELETSAGTITLNVDRNLPLTVDAATRLLGKVRTRDLKPEIRRGSFNSSSMLADFNGGGEAVHVRTSGGNIFVVGREPING